MKKHFVNFTLALVLGFSFAGCETTNGPTGPTHLLPTSEFVLKPGSRITATNKNGQIIIGAGEGTYRHYIWDGISRVGKGPVSAEGALMARDKRWYGSLGLFGSLPSDSQIGISRVVVEEAQMNFKSTEEALNWLKIPWRRDSLDIVYTGSGLVVGFIVATPYREQLDVELYQIYINGKKPVNLPGARESQIKISKL